MTVVLTSGLCSAALLVAYLALLAPLPYTSAEHLVAISGVDPLTPDATRPITTKQLAVLESTDALEAVAAYEGVQARIGSDPASRGVATNGVVVSEGIFQVLGAWPTEGGAYLSDDSPLPWLVLAASLRHSKFPSIQLGDVVYVDGLSHVFAGTMPAHFWFPRRDSGFLVPFHRNGLHDIRQPAAEGTITTTYVSSVGRLTPGSLASTEQRLNDILDQNGLEQTRLRPYTELLRLEHGQFLWWAMLAALMAFGLATVNAASIFLARGERLASQTAIRLALGASPMRTALDPWLHALALGAVAVPVASGVAFLTLKVLELSSAASLPALERNTAAVVWWCTGLCLLLPALGAIPAAIRAYGISTADAPQLKPRPRSASIHSMRLAVQVSVALALAIQATVLLASLKKITDASIGISNRDFTSVHASPRVDREPVAQVKSLLGVVQRLRSEGLRAAATTALPLTGYNRSISVRPFEDVRESLQVPLRLVAGDYFELAGIRAVRGRTFRHGASSERVGIVNTTFANLLSDREIIGRQIVVGAVWDPPITIVGVVPDVRHDGLLEPLTPELYLPLEGALALDPVTAQRFLSSYFLMADGADAGVVAQRLRTAVLNAMPGDLYDEPVRFRDLVWQSAGSRPMVATALSLLTLLSVALLAVGLYGTLSQVVHARARAFAIRVAVGAAPADLVKEALSPILLALGGGVVGSGLWFFALRTTLRSATLLPPDAAPPTFTTQIAFALAMVICALALAVWPSLLRLVRLEPTSLLRDS